MSLAGGWSDPNPNLFGPVHDTHVQVELWGTNDECGEGELLWTSPNLTAITWGPRCASVTPTQDYTHLRVAFRMTAPPLSWRQGCMTLAFTEPTENCQ